MAEQARNLIVSIQAGTERLWCDTCHMSSRRRLYAMTDRNVSVIGTICPHCRFREEVTP